MSTNVELNIDPNSELVTLNATENNTLITIIVNGRDPNNSSFIDSVGTLTVQNNPIVDNDNINTFASKTQSQIDDLAARKADKPNSVTTGGEIETGIDYITVNATQWMIGFVNYSAPIITFSNITLSSSGNQRYIAIYGDTNNTINKLEGNEASLAVYPDLPPNTIIIGYVLVGDGVISSPTPDLSAYATTNWVFNWSEPKILRSTRTTNYRLDTPNHPSQIIRNNGTVDINIQTFYTGCKINGQTNKTIVVKPNQFAFIKAIQNSDDNYYVFVVDEVPTTDTSSSNSITITAGEALVARNLVYLDTDGKYRKADYLIQSRIASEILIVDSTIANNATGTAILRGIVTGFTGLTVGENYYVGENGAIVSEANLPDIDGMFQKYIGEAVSVTTLYFNPSSHYYEIEVTGTVDGLATVRTLVDQHWFVVDGKPNADGTGTLTNGSEVRSIVSKTGGLGGNRAVYQDLTEAAITQQIPTRPNGGVPTYVNSEGGFLHIANGIDIQYRFVNNLGDIDATGEFWYVCRLHTGKSYEAIMSGDRGPELKRLFTGSMQYSPNDFVTGNQTFSYTPIEFETVIFHFIYNKTAGTCNIRVTDSVGDYRDLTTKTIPTTSFFRNFGVGTSSHPASHDFFAYLFKFGSAFNTTDRATILAGLKVTYPIGQLPSKSFARPTMGYNSGTTTFTITPNYVLRGGATSINNASTIVRWYMLKNNVSTGTYPNDALANITLIATTTGNQLSLNISSYPQFVTGGAGTGDEIVGAITVFDNLGVAFEIECATDPRRTI